VADPSWIELPDDSTNGALVANVEGVSGCQPAASGLNVSPPMQPTIAVQARSVVNP
jgi:hypothetical protein